MYVLVQRGVYRHTIFGVFDNLDLARSGAETAIAAEPDDYHQIEVVEVSLNELVEEKIVDTLERHGTKQQWEKTLYPSLYP